MRNDPIQLFEIILWGFIKASFSKRSLYRFLARTRHRAESTKSCFSSIWYRHHSNFLFSSKRMRSEWGKNRKNFVSKLYCWQTRRFWQNRKFILKKLNFLSSKIGVGSYEDGHLGMGHSYSKVPTPIWHHVKKDNLRLLIGIFSYSCFPNCPSNPPSNAHTHVLFTIVTRP